MIKAIRDASVRKVASGKQGEDYPIRSGTTAPVDHPRLTQIIRSGARGAAISATRSPHISDDMHRLADRSAAGAGGWPAALARWGLLSSVA